MGVVLAQLFQVVGRKVHDREPAAGRQCASRLRRRLIRTLRVVQHLMDDDVVEAAVGDRQRVHVGEPDRAVAQPGLVEIGAGDREHLAGRIDAESALDLGPEQLEHPAGPCADVEERAMAVQLEGAGQRRFDLRLVDMERSDAMPFGRVDAKIGRRRLRAAPTNLGESRPVALQGRILGREGGDQFAGKPGGHARPDQPEESPATFLVALEKTCLAHQFQVTGDPRLALPENLGELADGQFRIRQQRQQPKPGRLGRSTENGQNAVQGHVAFNHIRTSLYAKASMSATVAVRPQARPPSPLKGLTYGVLTGPVVPGRSVWTNRFLTTSAL